MLSSKTVSMKPLLESNNGIHLSAYIKNRGDLLDLQSQILDAIGQAEEYLAPVMTLDEMTKFLAPIVLFQEDAKRLTRFKGSVGLFRTEQSFRALSLPIEVETSCIVADTFHVKPILRWLQVDREFLLLGLESGSASLYQGDLHTFKHVDTVVYPEALRVRKNEFLRKDEFNETMEWLNGWIMNLTSVVRPRLFIAGKKGLTQPFRQMLQYENTSSTPILQSFSHQKSADFCAQIRSNLKAEAEKSFERALIEFHYSAEVKRAKGNVFTIAKAAVQGKIKKLLIADGIEIFGKLDRKSGELKLNGHDLDHEDDDILDDIAQTVLAHGGEVTIAAKNEIPEGRPILAIMDEQSQLELANEKIVSKDPTF